MSERGAGGVWGERVLSALVAVGALVVLGLAAWLDPSPLGHGTHMQLGLPDCTFHHFTGLPCPMCGATTAFAYMAHGRVLAAFVTQPFATFLFAVTVGLAGVGSAEAIQPRDRWRAIYRRIQPYETKVVLGLLAGLALGWAWTMAIALEMFAI